MIPAVIPPLTGLTVLVTRPAPQSAALATQIHALGGEALVLPAIDIRPLSATVSGSYELVVFVSVNAVEHGAHLIVKGAETRIAAIGRATAAALAAAQLTADIIPDHGFTSEALLAHPQLTLAAGARVLIVRGSGGRDVLQTTFASQGFGVEVLDVYERVLPVVDTTFRDQVETRWTEGEIDIVTATSVETLRNLMALLNERGRELLKTTPLVVPSPRVKDAAAAMGLSGECLVAVGADDEAILGALSQWHARARSSRRAASH